MSFANPYYLLLLLLIIPIVYWYIKRHKRHEIAMKISSLSAFSMMNKTLKMRLRHLPFILRMITISLLIIVLARPQTSNSWQSSTKEGIDIVVSLDISGTMLAEDLRPNRLQAAKTVVMEFIQGRPNDNIGLVLFAGESFMQCPLTSDHKALINLFSSVEYGMLEDGTAIGLGLANAVGRIKDSKAKSKVVILLTDGSNNAGDIAPITAAEIAQKMGVRVYTIGVGTKGMAPYPVQTPFGVQYQDIPVDIDEPMLQSIAEMTGGRYFRATDNAKLREIYNEIDQMEKTKIEVTELNKRNEAYVLFAILAMVSLLLEIILRKTYLSSIP